MEKLRLLPKLGPLWQTWQTLDITAEEYSRGPGVHFGAWR
jgi:hypothetical protein